MSSGKNLKIIDIELTRLKDANDSPGAVKDRFRFTTKRYYHNFLVKQAINDVVVIKKTMAPSASRQRSPRARLTEGPMALAPPERARAAVPIACS